jgi:predicted amidophosphoribosyltransferase
MSLVKEIKNSVLHLFFPHVCEGCGSEILAPGSLLCLRCHDALPATLFHLHANNPVAKLFWGRLLLANATSQYYFSRDSLMQYLMHQLKYRGNRELGIYLGQLMGESLRRSVRFHGLNALVPLPLSKEKERKRESEATTRLNYFAGEFQRCCSYQLSQTR